MRYKSEFPPFDYTHPRQWIIRCEKFFILSNVPRQDVLNLLFVHLTGRVGIWLESYIHELGEDFMWPAFAEAVCRRFGDSGASLMEDFASLKQWNGVDEFTDAFEGFKSLLLQSYPYLTENYFKENYIARLKQNLRCFVRTSNPRRLGDAIWYARQFEKGLKPVESHRSPSWNTKLPQSHPTSKVSSTHSNNPFPYNQAPKPSQSIQTTASKSPELPNSETS